MYLASHLVIVKFKGFDLGLQVRNVLILSYFVELVKCQTQFSLDTLVSEVWAWRLWVSGCYTYLDEFKAILHVDSWINQIFLDHFEVVSVFKIKDSILLLSAYQAALLEVITTVYSGHRMG